jgi:hypothetical protein
MVFLPKVVRATYEKGFRIHVTFNDGTEASVDFESWLSGPVFEPLKRVAYFRRFFVDGGTVVWPNGADIAPETLHETAQTDRSNKRPDPTASLARESRAEYRTRPKCRRG